MLKPVIKKTHILTGIALAIVLLVSACNIPTEQVANPDELVEKALQTLQWQSTQQAVGTMAAQLTEVSQETAVTEELPTQTPIIQVVTATLNPPTQTPYVQVVTATPNPPTQTPYVQVVTATPIPPTQTPTPKPIPCNIGSFVSDVTFPDGTEVNPGQSFVKTWRVKNVGSCTWTTAYDLVFYSGSAMNGPSVLALPASVAPGQTIDLSVSLKAPDASGTYTGYWMLRNQNDALFGVGSDGMTNLWVKVKVKATTGLVYDFAQKACDAAWSTPNGSLACPGNETSVTNGYVVKKTNAKREDGGVENDLSLVTRPNNANNGWIVGVYPAFAVKSGDQFRAAVNCEFDSVGCDISFVLRYQIGSADQVEFGSWHEIYDGKFRDVVVDLSALAGKDVKFILMVKNNTATNNKGLWIMPSIWRNSGIVTPTSTPVTPTPTATPIPVPCNIAKFVKDVSIPDWTTLVAGESFTKTWRVQNVGTCTWTTEYDLVFVSGESMSAQAIIPLTANVAPGQTVDLSVNMKAPSAAGDYTGFWMLRNQYDARFGVGKDANISLWVKIKVVSSSMFYDFAAKACDALWNSHLGPIPCPGNETSITNGYVVIKANAIREDGGTENELSLVTRPNSASDGKISGKFPAILVKAGDKFMATVNCEYNSPACDVTFKLLYQIGDGVVHELGSWDEIYEGNFKNVTVDLSPLAGQNVKFILFVMNNSTATDNKALWIAPGIVR